MNLELTLRSFPIAAKKLTNTPYDVELTIIEDGLRVVMTLDDLSQLRTILWHTLAMATVANWGGIVLDDMKQQLKSRTS